ncbi:hypothetical protein F5144DRAFT_261422 [Chaetomium tenue]|uniref:Uncharacterized protein n=1 Tax=Chaetomium tenue TaxID=1854479 RepID=A0ACB7P9S3_9PEZI|nr:hypothetical protein F5144DRAFT_261422 [Chaetomium globosum]
MVPRRAVRRPLEPLHYAVPLPLPICIVFFVWLRLGGQCIVQISICWSSWGPHTSFSLSTVHLYIVIVCMHARGPAALVLSCVSVENLLRLGLVIRLGGPESAEFSALSFTLKSV